MPHPEDIIVALSTPPASAALALVRLSGAGVHELSEKLCKQKLVVRRATYTSLWNEKDEVIDDAVVTLWEKPHSYTGEDMLEISCHGNMLIVDQLISRSVELGARIAKPGEFTERAFLNGKMDLTQAEGVMDLISAQTERALYAARKIEQGELGRLLLKEREKLLHLLAHLEAYIDFPEEDIEPDVGEHFVEKLQEVRRKLQSLMDTSEEGRRLKEGVRIVIAGKPNAGKSSLLNALLKKERAIVSARPGTTRDTIEESIVLEGILVRLIDTAGIRESEDEIEKMGIERTLLATQEADLILELIDGTELEESLISLPQHMPKIRCITKSDLIPSSHAPTDGLKISSYTGEGLDTLKQMIAENLKLAEHHPSQDIIVTSLRHQTLLNQAIRGLESAASLCIQKSPPELTSIEVRDALNAIGEIVGQVTNEDMLDRLFSSFCIGK